MSQNKRLLLFIALSIAVISAFNLFYERPRRERDAQERARQVALQNPDSPTAAAALNLPVPAPSAPPALAAPRPANEVLAERPRLAIETARVVGSIRLEGGRVDDIRLKDHAQTLDNQEPVSVFAPEGTALGAYAEFGWVPDQSSAGLAVPTSTTVWTASAEKLTQESPVTLSWDNGQGVLFERVVSIDADYMLTIEQKVSNRGEMPVRLYPFALVSRYAEAKHEELFILHEGAAARIDGVIQHHRWSAFKDQPQQSFQGATDWIGFTDKYWQAMLVPDPRTPQTARWQRITVAGLPRFQADLLGAAVDVAPGATAAQPLRLFAGAKEAQMLAAYQDSESTPIAGFTDTVDWGWFPFLTRPMQWALHHLFALVGNFGIAIMLLTLVVRGLMYPLARTSYVSMSKMKLVQPKLEEIRKQSKDDPMRMQQEIMKLYREEKVNPLAGCLPLLLQIPIFFAVYKVIFITIEMRHAPFFGWIHDLSAQDPTNLFTLFGLLPFTAPSFLHLGIWPILMALSQLIQQRLAPQPPDPLQARIFMLMPLIFMFVLASFPAGLVIYWTWSNIISIVQQKWITHQVERDAKKPKPPKAGAKPPAPKALKA